MNDRTKLPKWAQAEIVNLQNQVLSLQAHIAQLTRESPDSNVKVSYHGVYKDYGLPMDAEVDFYLRASRQKWRDMITVKHMRDGKILRVSTSGTLVIRPGGGVNVIELTTEGY